MKNITLNIIVFFIGILGFILITIVSIPFNIVHGVFYSGLVSYCRNLWLAFDQLANASMGYNHDTTISGNLGYKKKNNTANKFEKILSSILDKVDKNHVINSIEDDEDYEYRAKENK